MTRLFLVGDTAMQDVVFSPLLLLLRLQQLYCMCAVGVDASPCGVQPLHCWTVFNPYTAGLLIGPGALCEWCVSACASVCRNPG